MLFILNNLLKLFRHGESEMNVANVIGGNGYLSSAGEEYGNCLRAHIDEHVDVRRTKFVTSSLNRTRQTAKLAGINADQDANLDEISAGDFDGLTFDYVKGIVEREKFDKVTQ